MKTQTVYVAVKIVDFVYTLLLPPPPSLRLVFVLVPVPLRLAVLLVRHPHVLIQYIKCDKLIAHFRPIGLLIPSRVRGLTRHRRLNVILIVRRRIDDALHSLIQIRHRP